MVNREAQAKRRYRSVEAQAARVDNKMRDRRAGSANNC